MLKFPERNVLAYFHSLFRRSNRDAFWEIEGKIHEGGCVQEFFFINLQVAILQIHYELTSSKIISRYLIKWTPSKGYCFIFYKMLEKYLWNSFLLYLLVEILQLIHEIRSFQEVLSKRGVLRKFSKFTDN